MRRFAHLTAFLLPCAILALANLNLLAEPRLAAVARHRQAPSLTRTIFYGSDHHYEAALVLSLSGDRVTDFATVVPRPDDGRYSWRLHIVTTVFWIGEEATEDNSTPNTQSAWDIDWVSHYGGYDDPAHRANFIPTGFTPCQNPFYVALPYNDVTDCHTRPEAALVIPWFKNSFVRDGHSVCKGRWLAIRHGRRTCYAQWEDVGPFQTDHWQYVFGTECPRPNANHAAGLDVSPAVRDYLGMSEMDVCDWKFVDLWEVPDGPWALYPDDNPVAQLARLRHLAATAIASPHFSRPREKRTRRASSSAADRG